MTDTDWARDTDSLVLDYLCQAAYDASRHLRMAYFIRRQARGDVARMLDSWGVVAENTRRHWRTTAAAVLGDIETARKVDTRGIRFFPVIGPLLHEVIEDNIDRTCIEIVAAHGAALCPDLVGKNDRRPSRTPAA